LDYNNLTGPQRKIVREALLSAFDEDSLDLLLQDDLDRQPVRNIVPRAGFETMVGELVRRAVMAGWAQDLIEAARARSANQRLENLPMALRIAGVEADPRLAGSLESLVRAGGFEDFTLWANQFADIQRWVCRIEYPAAQGSVGYGTGFLIAPDLVLTNYHVVEAHQRQELDPSAIRCRFDYAVGPTAAPSAPAALDEAWLAMFRPYSASDPGDVGGAPAATELDYAVLRLARRAGDDVLGDRPRGVIPISATVRTPDVAEVLFIAQHPEGDPLKLSIGVVQPRDIKDGLRLRYDANTERGSSGSPCFDRSLNLVALHHGGDPNWKRPVFNQGVPIQLIAADMAQRGFAGV